MTVRELSLRMGTRELGRWRKYAVQRGLATDRLQLQMAVLAYMVAAAFGGGEKMQLSDYLVDLSPAEPAKAATEPEDGVGAISALSGRGVRVLGQKRKQRKGG